MQLILCGIILGCLSVIYWFIKRKPRYKALHRENQKKAKQLLLKLQQQAHTPSRVFVILRHTDFFIFEEILLLCFKQRGFKIQRNVAYTGDGGVDGAFFDRFGHQFLIQAKRYQDTINPHHISEFAEVIQQHRAAGGFFIHTGRTGPLSYQNLTPSVRLISGEKLLKLLNAKLSKIEEV